MAEGEGRTINEALDNYAAQKATEIIGDQGVNEMRFDDAMNMFETTYHPIEISIKLRPHNQWVKGFKVADR